MYDQKCYDLAAYVLADLPDIDSDDARASLAQAIQDEIESWLSVEVDMQAKKGAGQ